MERLEAEEVEAGRVVIIKVLESIHDSGDLILGPSDLDAFPVLEFLKGNTARVKGNNFEDPVRNFTAHIGHADLLDGIEILKNDADVRRVKAREPLAEIKFY